MTTTATSKTVLLTLLALSPIALLHLVHQLDKAHPELGDHRIASMRVLDSQASVPPLDGTWRTATWDEFVPGEVNRDRFNSTWVEVVVPEREPGQPQGLYLRYPRANVEVFWGPELLGATGVARRPLPFVANSAYFDLPDALQNNGRLLYLRYTRERAALSLAGIYVGPREILRAQYARDRLLTFWIPGAVATLMLGLAIPLFILYTLGTRRFAYFGLYALIVVLWALHTVHGLITDIPLHHWTWFAGIYLLLWWVILTPAFANRFFELGLRRLEVGVGGAGCLLTLPIIWFLVRHDIANMYQYIATIWVPFVLLCSFITFCLYGLASFRNWSFEALSFFFVGALSLIVGVRDHLYDFTDWVPGTTYYTKYTAMAQVALINLFIAQRYARSERGLLALNRDLEARVEAKAQALEASYVERASLERERTLAAERERLMRDMHDGLGGQLIHALALSEDEQHSSQLRDSIEHALMDLRLIVDSLTPQAGDLITLLATFRHQSRRVWEKQGIDVKWQVDPQAQVHLEPDTALAVLRIVQECSTNALKHSGAKQIGFEVLKLDDRVRLMFWDNGHGFDLDAPRTGYGVDNMLARAAKAGMEMGMESDTGGTRVWLEISFDKTA